MYVSVSMVGNLSTLLLWPTLINDFLKLFFFFFCEELI